MATVADAQTWLLRWSSQSYGWSFQGDGRPWGDGTYLAAREAQPGPPDPWDYPCKVTPLLGGFEAMRSVRQSLEDAIAYVKNHPGAAGHVYISDWRLNLTRDLSEANAWGTQSWTSAGVAVRDETVVGLLLQLMQAGIHVRVLVWQPLVTGPLVGLGAHMVDHVGLWLYIAYENLRLTQNHGSEAVGVMGLDLRTADSSAATHHQKMVVVRVGNLADADSVHVAYCGGVDLAFTRRDAPGPGVSYDPSNPRILGGDWQSGDSQALEEWPFDATTNYSSVTKVRSTFGTVNMTQDSDLPTSVYGDGKTAHQMWHDQHLRIEGPFVATLEGQFCERWRAAGHAYAFDGPATEIYVIQNFRSQQVIFSSTMALSGNKILPLPDPVAVPSVTGATSFVQMWRTMPYRQLEQLEASQLTRGEFTCQAGIANATAQATEFIWIFDQYFWSRPLARLLNERLAAKPSLHVVVVLPPHADANYSREHWARKLALDDLTAGDASIGARVAVYNLWHGKENRGIYCHAKTQTYDDKLLVCGSCNLNRRSFLCDNEIAAAVVDETVVRTHHARLLQLLGLPLIEPNYESKGWGAGLFNAIRQAVPARPTASTLLWPDPWSGATVSALPNGVSRKQAGGLLFESFDETFLEPTSLPLSAWSLENPYTGPDGIQRDATLATIVERLESTPKRPWW